MDKILSGKTYLPPAMSTGISISRTQFLAFSTSGSMPCHKLRKFYLSPTMKMDSKSTERVKKEELSIQRQRSPPIPYVENPRSSGLRFNRLQPSNDEVNPDKKLEFGKFVAREAIIDEELWIASCLRAESHWEGRKSHWEGRPAERIADYAIKFKMKFSDQEFNAIKSRYRGQNGQKYMCVVAVWKDYNNVKLNVIKSVVGTLDFSIRYLLQGESFPGDRERHHFCSITRKDENRYVYVSNVVVALYARRQGIATNMLYFVIASARASGVEHVYAHVHRYNEPALELFQKIGFEMVDEASSQLVAQQMYLLCYMA